MRTIQFEIQDDVYDSLIEKGINLNNQIKEFLYSLADDGYRTISYDEAQERVSKAIKRYKNKTGSYLNEEEYINFKDSLIQKYANN